jgi:hypothetical protein
VRPPANLLEIYLSILYANLFQIPTKGRKADFPYEPNARPCVSRTWQSFLNGNVDKFL